VILPTFSVFLAVMSYSLFSNYSDIFSLNISQTTKDRVLNVKG